MLGLGYPGGAAIDRLACSGNSSKIMFTRPYLDKEGFDFSFSGIKTAVLRYIQTHENAISQEQADIAAGFQEAVLDVLIHKLLFAAEATSCRHVALVGGVAANQRLRERLAGAAGSRKLEMHIPPIALCGDNAAMIAAAGYHALRYGAGRRCFFP
jgi:N6-L-threonylcarbamoyladenine synthase